MDQILVTQSSSLSVEDHTFRCVVGSEPTSLDYQVASGDIIELDKLQLIVPTLMVWLYCMADVDDIYGHLWVV